MSISIPLTPQELHNLAMNTVGKDLEKQGYEFLAVNSTLLKDPQFVALKKGKLHFVFVKAITYPDDPNYIDPIYAEAMKLHAEKFKAQCFFGYVGLADASDYNKPLCKDLDFVVNYPGIKKW